MHGSDSQTTPTPESTVDILDDEFFQWEESSDAARADSSVPVDDLESAWFRKGPRGKRPVRRSLVVLGALRR